jgi:hypothetical protein
MDIANFIRNAEQIIAVKGNELKMGIVVIIAASIISVIIATFMLRDITAHNTLKSVK